LRINIGRESALSKRSRKSFATRGRKGIPAISPRRKGLSFISPVLGFKGARGITRAEKVLDENG